MTHNRSGRTADTAPFDEAGTSDSELVRCACGEVHRTDDAVHAEVCDA